MAGFHIFIEMFPFLSFSYLSVPAAPLLQFLSFHAFLRSFPSPLFFPVASKEKNSKLDPKQILGWFNSLVFLVAGGSPAFDTVEPVHAFVSCGICVRGKIPKKRFRFFTSTGLWQLRWTLPLTSWLLGLNRKLLTLTLSLWQWCNNAFETLKDQIKRKTYINICHQRRWRAFSNWRKISEGNVLKCFPAFEVLTFQS